MRQQNQRRIRLVEYQPTPLARGALSEEEAATLFYRFPNQVTVEFPTLKTGQQWLLRSEGWVGYIPVSHDLGLELQPKVPLANIFRMLEYAYDLDPKWLQGMIASEELDEFFERLGAVLAKRVLKRARMGLHRAYIREVDTLPYVRGALDLVDLCRRPGTVNLACQYEEHTADIDDNRILAWTLSRVARSALCTDRARPIVRRAYRALVPAVRVQPFRAQACVRRSYDRLNDDYRSLHALCRFFLENTGPTHESGDRGMLPFLIEMSSLYELFVAEWLKANLPARYRLRYQEPLTLGGEGGVHFKIDMVIYDRVTDTPVCVLDAKYKAPDRVDNADLNQVVVYAKAKRCQRAFLVYPAALSRPANVPFDDITVRSATFSLGGDLDTSGQGLLAAVLGGIA